MIHAIAAQRLFDGANFLPEHAVVVERGRIGEVLPTVDLPADVPTRHLPPGQMLTPGYVDLQVNGGGDVLFLDHPTPSGVAAIVAAHRALGTTSLLPTMISGDPARIAAALALAPSEGAPGVHLEGPFLNPQRRGIHPAASIRAMGDSDLAQLCRPTTGVRLITLAPECVPPDTVARLTKAGNAVFAGHTEAGWDTMVAAADAGLRGVTHLFNAMSQITPRAPGVVGAALALPGLTAGLILDGLHVHPANARIALGCLGAARLFLVSDAMPTVGGAAVVVRIGDTEVRLRDGRLTGPDGTLGGAHLCLAEAVRQAVRRMGATVADALRMATSTPAACAGLTDRGRLVPGARADLLALDEALTVRAVWVGGEAERAP